MTSTETSAKFRRMRPEDRREQILGEAYSLIARSGFNAVSLADVAKACNVQKSAVLHYFPTMNNLLMEVLAMREAQVYDQFRAGEGEGNPQDAAAARAQFTRVFEEQLQRPELVRLKSVLAVESLAPDHPAHQYYTNFDRLAVAEMRKSLSWKSDPDLAATELLAFWAGLDLAWHRNPELDTTKVWNAFCDRFFV
jgi:AcrR family transcriptional regulator